MTRTTLATIIAERLIKEKETLKKAYENSESEIGPLIVDIEDPSDIILEDEEEDSGFQFDD